MKVKSTVRHGAYGRIDFRCPKCNKNIYGRPQKCEYCGEPLEWKKGKNDLRRCNNVF